MVHLSSLLWGVTRRPRAWLIRGLPPRLFLIIQRLLICNRLGERGRNHGGEQLPQRRDIAEQGWSLWWEMPLGLSLESRDIVEDVLQVPVGIAQGCTDFE